MRKPKIGQIGKHHHEEAEDQSDRDGIIMREHFRFALLVSKRRRFQIKEGRKAVQLSKSILSAHHIYRRQQDAQKGFGISLPTTHFTPLNRNKIRGYEDRNFLTITTVYAMEGA